MNQTGISLPFNHGMVTLFLSWQSLIALIGIVAVLVALSCGFLHLINPRGRANEKGN